MWRFNNAKVGANVSRERGFTLIELLVGIMVAILASSAIMVSFSVFDNRKRTTQSGSDAQVNGAYALQMMEREIRMGGYGFAGGNSVNDDTPNGCILSGGFSNFPAAPPPASGAKQNALNFAINTAMAVPPAAALMAPVLIVDDANNHGAGGSDVIRVMYGNSPAVAPFEPAAMASATANVIQINAMGLGVNVGDTVLIYDSLANSPLTSVRRCALRRVTRIEDSSTPNRKTWSIGLPKESVVGPAPAPANGNHMPPNANYPAPAAVIPPVFLYFDTATPPPPVPALAQPPMAQLPIPNNTLTYNNTGVSPNPYRTPSAGVDTLMLLRSFRILTFSTLPAAGESGAGLQSANVLYQYEANTSLPAPQQFELAPDIVNIQAQYGLDNDPAANTGAVVGQWIDATAAAGWDQASIVNRMQATPLNTSDPNTFSPMARVKAVRLALVARSTLLEQRRVAGGCNAPGADQPMGGATLRVNGLLEFNWPDGTVGQANVRAADVNNWSCYRYQVFQTVVPLRSVIWSKVK